MMSTATGISHAAACPKASRAGMRIGASGGRKDSTRISPQLPERSGGEDPSLLDDDDAIAESLDQFELVARKQNRRAPLRLSSENVREGINCGRVKPSKRLVQHEQLRMVHERYGELDPLLIAVGKSDNLVQLASVETEPQKPAPRFRLGGDRIEPMQLSEVGQLIENSHLWIRPTLLRHIAESQSIGRADSVAGPCDVPTLRAEDAHDGPHGRRLACSVPTDEPHDLARADLEHEPVYGDPLTEAVEKV